MEEIVKNPFVSASVKRLLVFLATTALIVLNKKLNLGMGVEEIAGLAVLATGYVVQSGVKDAAKEKGKAAAAEITTLNEAVKELQRKPLP